MASAAEQRDELVERVARALCVAKHAGAATWDSVLIESEKAEFRRMARAAVETIRNEQ